MSGDHLTHLWMRIAAASTGVPPSVASVCTAAAATVDASGAGVTVIVNATVRDIAHATDTVAAEIEEWQLTFGQGPCVDAFARGGPVLVADLSSTEYSARWPAFTPAALDSGAKALFALPIQVGAIRLGVLDLYRTRAGSLSRAELADGLMFADAAGALLIDAADGDEPAWRRDDPTVHNAQVHQATGMLMVQLKANAEVAFARLRAHAYAHDRRLGDVAREVVERRLRFDTDPLRDGTP
jgi:hypothetical protein